MTITMHQVSVPVLVQGLTGLRGVLAKGAAAAEAGQYDPQNLLQARLAPDMFPLLRQVQIACDFAKGAAGRLASQDLPAYEDTETSFAELEARIDKTIAYLEGLPALAFDGAEDREIALMRRGERLTFTGRAYLLEQGLPNFWFHVTTAFAILRHNGVDVGKKDFLAVA